MKITIEEHASSINSLLDQYFSIKINIYIVHNNKESLDILLSRFTQHEFLNELKIFSINTEGMHFLTNVEKKHVSVLSYYRIHLDKVFENIDLKNCIYLDSDIILLMIQFHTQKKYLKTWKNIPLN